MEETKCNQTGCSKKTFILDHFVQKVTLILESVSFISCILPTNVAKLRITDAYSGLHQTAKSESFANLDFPKVPNVTFYALDCLFSLSVGILLTLHKTNFFVVNEK